MVLREKRVYREEWESLLGRLDALGDEINTAMARSTRIEEPEEWGQDCRSPKKN